MRKLYKEVVQFCVPEGFSRVLAEVADSEHLTVSAYVRRLALQDVERRNAPAGRDRCSAEAA